MAKSNTASQEPEYDAETGEIIEKTGTDVTVTSANTTALAVADEFDYGDDAGLGTENQSADDVSVPFYVILQPGSPIVQQPDSAYKAGQIVNNTTGEVVGDTKRPFNFIPCYTTHEMVEWVPRDNGGGLVGSHPIDGPLATKVRAEQPLGKYKHPDNGNDLIETFYVYGVAVDHETGAMSPGVMSFSSTHIKPYKDWQFRAKSVVLTNPANPTQKVTSKNMPLWAFGYAITTSYQSKNGFNWYLPVVGWADENAMKSRVSPRGDLYAYAKSVYEGVSSGRQKADTAGLERAMGAGGDAVPEKGSATAEDAPY